MVEVNEKDLSLEIKETLSFQHCVQNVYDEAYSEFEYNKEDYDEEVVNKFLNYELTDEDKIEMLNNIKDEYEYNCCHDDGEVSIFDYNVIRKVVDTFIEEHFDLTNEIK